MIKIGNKKMTAKDMAISELHSKMLQAVEYFEESTTAKDLTRAEIWAVMEAMDKEICIFEKKHDKRLSKVADACNEYTKSKNKTFIDNYTKTYTPLY